MDRPGVSGSSRAVAGAALAMLFGAPEARCGTEEELRAWLEAERAAIASWDGPGPSTIIRVREYLHSFFPRAEADRLREACRGRPDHPERFRIELHDKYQREGPRTHDTALLGSASVGLRAFRDDRTGEEGYRDTVVSPEQSWSLTPERLVLTKGSSSPNNEHRVDSQVSVAIGNVRLVLFGPGTELADPALQVERVAIDATNGSWEAVVAGPGPVVWELSGRSLDPAGGWVIDEAWCVEYATNREWTGMAIRAEGWRYDAILGRMVAGRVTRYHADRTVMHRYEFVGAEPSPAPIAEAIRPPRVDSTDVFRGPVTATHVLDYVGREHTAKTVTPTGMETEVIGGEDSGGSLIGTLRAAGWIALAGAVAALVWLRVRRAG